MFAAAFRQIGHPGRFRSLPFAASLAPASLSSARTFTTQHPPAGDPLLLRFYTKEQCHLCDEALVQIDKVAEKIPIELEEIDIEHDENHVEYRKYRFDIPVLTLASTDELVMKHKFPADKLEQKLRAILDREIETGKRP